MYTYEYKSVCVWGGGGGWGVGVCVFTYAFACAEMALMSVFVRECLCVDHAQTRTHITVIHIMRRFIYEQTLVFVLHGDSP